MTPQETWETYASSWKAQTPTQKQELYRKSLSPQARYTDPLMATRGWDELLQYMQQFHQQVPGGHFVTTYFLEHHGRSIARWNMVDGGGNVLGDGISYGEYGDDGKLVAMTGFFDPPA